RNSGPTTVAIQRCDLAVDKVPVDLTGELHQLVPHVDDLVQLRAEQITRSCRLVLLRPHRSLRCGDRITLLDSRESRKQHCKLPGHQTRKPCNSSQQSRQKTTPPQCVRNSSRATPSRSPRPPLAALALPTPLT